MTNTTTRNPWAFVPLLYFMQAIPVALVQEVATVIYKDFGVANEPITRWTSLIAIPWSLQMLLGPLVDLNGTKRRWILGGQIAMAGGFVLAPLVFRLPNAFELSLAIFFFVAVFSALCNTATDGFYLLALGKDRQAQFAGVQTTCYRLGRLFCTGVLVYLTGVVSTIGDVLVSPSVGQISLVANDKPVLRSSLTLRVVAGELTDELGNQFSPKVVVPASATGYWIDVDGVVRFVGSDDQSKISLPQQAHLLGSIYRGETGAVSRPSQHPWGINDARVAAYPKPAVLSRRDGWMAALFVCAALYTLGFLINRRTLPRPSGDEPGPESESSVQENRRNIARTVTVITGGLSAYFALSAVWRIFAHGLWFLRDGSKDGQLHGWMLGEHGLFGPFDLGLDGLTAELLQLIVCGVLAVAMFRLARRTIVGTPMGVAFASYFAQPKIVWILGLLMFYRFSEAMVAKISPLFLKDSLQNGGMGFGNEQIGLIKGIIGVLGIVIGGICGGYVISRLTLKRSFFPIALTMHAPILLYLWAAYTRPSPAGIAIVEFVDQFGYGFGFAGYMIFQMSVARRGQFPTSHYAMGVGIGALFISLAGISAGILQSNFAYTGMFWAAILCSIPGLVTLLFVPTDETVTV